MRRVVTGVLAASVILAWDACRGARAASGPISSDAIAAAFQGDEYRASWALGMIRADKAYAQGYTGKNVLVGVVDDRDDLDHPEFAGRVVFNPWRGADLPSGDHAINVAGVLGAAKDDVGTHGVAYESWLIPISFETRASSTAIHNTVTLGARVINGSYGPPPLPAKELEDGSPNPHHREVESLYIPLWDSDSAGDTHAEAQALRYAAAADVVMVFAAGNEYVEQPVASRNPSGNGLLPYVRPRHHDSGVYRFIDAREIGDPDDPDTYPVLDMDDSRVRDLDFSDLEGTLIAAVAVDSQKNITPYSNRCGVTWRWCMAAPGGREPVGWEQGRDAAMLFPAWNDGYDLNVGTSFAAPMVAGAAAVLRQAFPYMTARQIIELLLTTTDTSAHLADRAIYGRGLLDLGRAVQGPAEFGGEGFPRIFDVDTSGHDSWWTGDIRGQGGLAKRGPGTLVLTGTNTYTGPTTVHGGTLQVEGSIAQSALAVARAGTLSGSGMVGPAHIRGTVAPGMPGRPLRVQGDYRQHAESRYIATIAQDGVSADRIEVRGQAHIDNAQLLVQGLSASALGRDYTILHADHGIEGGFTDVPDPYLFVDFHQGLAKGDSRSYRFGAHRNTLPFADMARTGNQRAVARGIESTGLGSPLYDKVVMTTDGDTLPVRFDAWSGEIHPSALAGLQDAAGAIRAAALVRARQMLTALDYAGTSDTGAAPSRRSAWGRFIGTRGTWQGDGNTSDMRGTGSGMLFGTDWASSPDTGLGLIGGFENQNLKINDRASRARVDSYWLGAYGATHAGIAHLRLGGAYGWHELATNRNMGLSGAAKADYHASTMQWFSEVGVPQAWGNTVLEPYAGLAYADTRARGFSESGQAGLHGAPARLSQVYSTLGMRASTAWALKDGAQLALDTGLGWRRAYGSEHPRTTFRFAGGDSFNIDGVPVMRNALLVETAVTVSGDTMRMAIGYTGQLGRSPLHGIRADLTWMF